jgi:hypothetical protein
MILHADMRHRLKVIALLVVVTSTAPVWIPGLAALIVVVLIGQAVKMAALYTVAWTFWIGRSPRRVLFVYSDSPNWKSHVESRILPRLPADAVILNWSRRAQWPRYSVAVLLFRGFAGDREFNPIGLVFERWRRVEDYRFWQPFRDAKHGREGALEFVEKEFLRRAAG